LEANLGKKIERFYLNQQLDMVGQAPSLTSWEAEIGRIINPGQPRPKRFQNTLSTEKR
jgi:hypothetical protein